MNTEVLLSELVSEIKGLRGDLGKVIERLDGPGELMTMQDAAKYARTTVRTIQRRVASGDLTPHKMPGGRRVLFERAQLESVLQVQKGV